MNDSHGGKTDTSWNAMSRDASQLTLEQFEILIETFGANPARWPQDRVAGMERMARQSQAARRLLDEARALDRVLAAASSPNPARTGALADRIFAAAAASAAARPAETGAEVIRLTVPASRQKADRSAIARGAAAPSAAPVVLKPRSAALPPAASPDVPHRRSSIWGTASALAASLVFGVVIGMTDVYPTSAIGLPVYTDAASLEAEIAFSGLEQDGLNLIEEDHI